MDPEPPRLHADDNEHAADRIDEDDEDAEADDADWDAGGDGDDGFFDKVEDMQRIWLPPLPPKFE